MALGQYSRRDMRSTWLVVGTKLYLPAHATLLAHATLDAGHRFSAPTINGFRFTVFSLILMPLGAFLNVSIAPDMFAMPAMPLLTVLLLCIESSFA